MFIVKAQSISAAASPKKTAAHEYEIPKPFTLLTANRTTAIRTICSAKETAANGAVFRRAIKYPLIFDEMPIKTSEKESAFKEKTALSSFKALLLKISAPKNKTAKDTDATAVFMRFADFIIFLIPDLLPVTS